MIEVDEALNLKNELSSIIDTDGKFLLYSTKEMDEIGAITKSLQPDLPIKPGEILYMEITNTQKITGVKTPLYVSIPTSGIFFPWKIEEALHHSIEKGKQRIYQLLNSPDDINFPTNNNSDMFICTLRTSQPIDIQALIELSNHLIVYRTITRQYLIEATFVFTEDPKDLARKAEPLGRTINLHSLSNAYGTMISKMKLNPYHLWYMTLSNKFPLKTVNNIDHIHSKNP